MSANESDRRRQRGASVIFIVLLAGLVGVVVFAALGRGGTPQPSTAPSSEPAAVEHVMLMAVNTPGDDFTTPMGTDVALTPLAAEGSAGVIEVAGDAVGLYGGSMKLSSCERAKMVDYLDAHPAKAEAWAQVQGIEATEIRSFVAGLTPLVLRADTLVTNHGFFDGRATEFASVLQAGTAVLVNDHGLPVVRCFCGNPLTAAPALSGGAIYDGPAWKDFAPATSVRVKPSSRVIDGFEVVDTDTDSLFTRPTATAGGQDSSTGQAAPQGIEGTPTESGQAVAAGPPAAAGSAAPSVAPSESSVSGDRPAGEPMPLFEVSSIAGVSSGPQRPSEFTLSASAYVTSIVNYHYLNGGTSPGTIGLESADGTMFGPWPATGSEGQGGVQDAYWTVSPNVVIPAGTYTVVDSDPGTWSWALDTKKRGMTLVQGIELQAGDAPAPAPAPAPAGSAAAAVDCSVYPEGSVMWTLCNHDPLNE